MSKRYITAVIALGVVLVNSAFAADNRTEQMLQQFQQLSKERQAATKSEAKSDDAPQIEQIRPRQVKQEPIESPEDRMDEEAFQAMMKDAFPLTPNQLTRLRSAQEDQLRAAAAPAATPPKPVAISKFINLSPGSTPPVVRLQQGFVTSLVFLDSTGADWPIEAFDIGNPAAFDVQWDKSSNTMMVQALKSYTYGNMAVRLRGLSTPVMITLIPSQQVVDYRVDMRIPGLGPNALLLPVTTGLAEKLDTVLLSVLDGVAPPHSKELIVQGGDAQAWLDKRTMYLRTRLKVISPGWVASMSSADGMQVYQMPKTPVVLVSMHGRITGLKIEGLID